MTLVALLLVMFMMMWQQSQHQQKSKNKYRCAPNESICGGPFHKPCDHCCNNHSLGNKAYAWGLGWYCKDDMKGKPKLSEKERDSDMYK